MLQYLKLFVYCVKAVNKGKVGYQCSTDNIVADIDYGLFLFLIYIQVILIFSVQLIIGHKLFLV